MTPSMSPASQAASSAASAARTCAPAPAGAGDEYARPDANKAMQLLGIADWGDPPHGGGQATRPLKITTWAAQAALSRPGRRSLTDKDIDDIKRVTLNPEKLKWPRKRVR